jgi:hypothetical protein
MAALLLCLKRLLIAVAALLFLASFWRNDRLLALYGLALLGVILLLALMHLMFASAAKCPLCLMPVLSRKGCVKHSSAKRFLGSYRLRVALTILLKGSFRCPYCNEPTILRLKGLP